MALGIILSTIVYEYSRHIWYLDASVALVIAFGLAGYGIRFVPSSVVLIYKFKASPLLNVHVKSYKCYCWPDNTFFF